MVKSWRKGLMSESTINYIALIYLLKWIKKAQCADRENYDGRIK